MNSYKPSIKLAQVKILYKLVLTFKSGDKTLVCDHSVESY